MLILSPADIKPKKQCSMRFKFTFRNVLFVINIIILALLTPIVLVPALLAYLVRANKFSNPWIFTLAPPTKSICRA